MPSVVQKNYSKCPLKKRPVHFSFDENASADEPQNLSIKKELNAKIAETVINNKNNISMSVDEEKVSSSVIVPTPTYPKYGVQPWNFHISPYTAEFYRTINNPHQHQFISPLRGDLSSPSSPSEGSISPPPHYLHGRASSVSPPIRSEIEIYRPIGVRHAIIKPEVLQQHRYVPYQLPYQPFGIGLTPSPISPSYSDSSYYSMRSVTPESICSPVPEDLSLKNVSPASSSLSTSSSSQLSPTHSISNFAVPHDVHDNKEKSLPPRYQCTDCNKSYSTFSGLTKHQNFHCPAAEANQVKKSFSCKDCDKTYVSLGALKMHIRTHTLPCKCNICGKAFSRPWLLQGHIRTHTGEKPFSCQHCHRAFADRSNLRAHLQTHSDIKKYSCTTCSKTFSRMSLLTKHNEGGCPGTPVVLTNCDSPQYMYQEH